MTGKLVIDTTNPLDFGPADLELALGFSDSGGETAQRLAPGASVFQTMNQVGFRVLDSAGDYPLRPTMFIVGDDASRKPAVMALVADLGFEPLDCSGLVMSRLLEAYAMVWTNRVVAKGETTLRLSH